MGNPGTRNDPHLGINAEEWLKKQEVRHGTCGKVTKNSRKRWEFESLTIGIFTQQEMLIFQHQSWYIYPSPEKCGVNPTDPGHILMIVHHISSYGDMKTWPTFTEYHQLSQKVMISIVPYYISKFKIKRITAYNTYSWTAHGSSVPYPILASPAASSPGTMVSSASLTTCSARLSGDSKLKRQYPLVIFPQKNSSLIEFS